MTLQEFKAWFEGFCENLDGTPNDKQWKRIRARVKDIDGCSVTPVIIERWRQTYIPDYGGLPVTPIQPRRVWSGTNTTVSFSTSNEDEMFNSDPITLLADMGKEEARTLS